MKNPKQIFHTISYLQYPLLLVGLFLIAKPIFKGYNFLSENPEYLFETYNNALIFLGLTLSFASLQDPSKTSLRYEQRIWRNPKKAKTIFIITICTTALFFVSGIIGFLAKESLMRNFSYSSLILGIGLLGYLKLQLDIFENYREKRKSAVTKNKKRTESN